ncbi:hypothetical protein, partial [Paraburkholderia sediminicola]|uniref:hypothetical protein n=1 Tax=Paraburkholderia sediminicola TaxID=458836 RepID=UPI0038B8CA97
PEGLLALALLEWRKLDASNLIDPTADLALSRENRVSTRPRPHWDILRSRCELQTTSSEAKHIAANR